MNHSEHEDGIIAAVDIGGARITCVLAKRDQASGKAHILSGATLPCKGVQSGTVIDITEAAACLDKVIAEAEHAAGQQISGLVLGLRGEHIDHCHSHGAYNIARTDKEITGEDIFCVFNNTKAISLPVSRTIMQVIKHDFIIDGQSGILNPEGMDGSLLELDASIITADSAQLNNVVKSVAKLGLEPQACLVSVAATAEATLTEDEKLLGALLIDLGAENISCAVYMNGRLQHLKEFPFGCDLITSDIMWGLHATSRDTATTVLQKYAVASENYLDEQEIISIYSSECCATREIKATDLLDIVKPRVEELFEKVRTELMHSGFNGIVSTVILTGGGALLRGIDEIAGSVIGTGDVRISGIRFGVAECDDYELLSPTYVTALALAVAHIEQAATVTHSVKTNTSAKHKLTALFKNLNIFGD